ISHKLEASFFLSQEFIPRSLYRSIFGQALMSTFGLFGLAKTGGVQMHRDNNNESTFFLIQLFILLMLNTMIRTQYETLQDIGNLSIYMTLIVMFVFLVCSFIKRKELNFSNVYVTLFLFILVNFFSFLLTDHVDSIYLMTLLMFYLFILSSIRVEWKPVHIKVLTYILGVLLIFLFIHWVQLGFPDTRFKSIFQNPNYLAVL